MEFEKIVQDAPILFYCLDIDQKYLWVNNYYLKVSGMDAYAGFLGKTLYEIYPAEIACSIVKLHKSALETGQIFPVEELVKNIATGEVSYFKGKITPLYEEGKIVGTIATAVDITEEKKEAEHLKVVKVLEHLEKVAQLLPTPFYWLGLNQEYLGINKLVIEATGTSSYEKDFAGKTPYNLYPREMAEDIVEHHRKVLQTGETLSSVEESIRDVTTGEVKHFNATIAPLRDDNGNIIGTIGTSIDITRDKKEADRLGVVRVFEHLEKIAQIIPAPFYWLDTNNVVLGGNEHVLKASGALHYENFIGKTAYDLYPKEMADNIILSNEEIMQTGKIISQEEPIEDITTGEVKYFNAIKAPLHDDKNQIIGTIGISIDITAQKEAESLKLENTANKIKLQEQEKFTRTADQVAHDIRSPLASLLMIVKSCMDIPETERIALREAAISIGDIADNLLNQYQVKPAKDTSEQKREPILLSATLLQLLTEKKFQYKERSVKFSHEFSLAGEFAFIRIELTAFKRMISNLVNNAVDAFEGREGQVVVKLDATQEHVNIIISDNGKGMPPEVAEKIMNGVAVTQGKADGHGIGLTQVWETLSRNYGEMHIHSTVGQGTAITLTFPRMKAPDWIAEAISLTPKDIIVILDDDRSIHAAWDSRLESILEQASEIHVKHFEICHDAIDFIHTLSEEERKRVFLLTDFELLKQDLNGLHVVEKTKVQRSILVTSHYANVVVRERAVSLGTKVLPKQLASEIPIILDLMNISTQEETGEEALKKVDLILVDDDPGFAEDLIQFVFRNNKVDYFQDPKKFKEALVQYPKDTRIYLDNNFSRGLKGTKLAKELHELGYTRIYLLSGDVFAPGELPDYIKVVRKDDIDNIKDW